MLLPHRPARIATAIALIVLAADQASKAWAWGSLWPEQEITVIPGWLWFRLRTNSGASLGLLRGQNLLFIAVSAVVVVAVAAIVLRGAPRMPGAVALGAVAGGAASNLVDRVRLGGVIDFIEVHLWPTDFNLADAAIRRGVAVFVLTLFLDRRWRSRPDGASRPTG
jgi:signal peptidase II